MVFTNRLDHVLLRIVKRSSTRNNMQNQNKWNYVNWNAQELNYRQCFDYVLLVNTIVT